MGRSPWPPTASPCPAPRLCNRVHASSSPKVSVPGTAAMPRWMKLAVLRPTWSWFEPPPVRIQSLLFLGVLGGVCVPCALPRSPQLPPGHREGALGTWLQGAGWLCRGGMAPGPASCVPPARCAVGLALSSAGQGASCPPSGTCRLDDAVLDPPGCTAAHTAPVRGAWDNGGGGRSYPGGTSCKWERDQKLSGGQGPARNCRA